MSHTERSTHLEKRLPNTDVRCSNDIHPGKIPSVWEVNHKCIHCPWMMTRADFDAWCRQRKVFFIGG